MMDATLRGLVLDRLKLKGVIGVADMTGRLVNREQVIRVLSALVREGLIVQRPGGGFILKREALELARGVHA